MGLAAALLNIVLRLVTKTPVGLRAD